MKQTAENIIQGKRIEDVLNAIKKFANGNVISFACWRMPEDSTTHLIVQFGNPEPLIDVDLENSGSGFLLSPYDRNKSKLFIKSDFHIKWNNESDLEIIATKNSEQLLEAIVNYTSSVNHSFNSIEIEESSSFKSLVSKSVDEINKETFTKVVPSRKKEISYTGEFNVGEVFTKLVDTYQSAFVSTLFTPDSGLWVGATPELLISTNKNTFKTVALAGTQKFDESKSLADTAWTQKEIEEQALVSRYIINCFKKIRLREFEEHGPKTVKAGNLIHLKTEFKVDMKSTNFPELGSTMLNLLHPTSAVCGMPMQNAQDFLLANEGYDREFYSGYLGPTNIDNNTAQFVNLRCMKVEDGKITLYAGAGVTEDSNPEKEWIETELKMNTILNVINAN